jgi:hypothetical protein
VSIRPITDFWILGRPKVKYYGAYPNGFLERARILMGVGIDECMWHVCGGMAKSYPGKRGIGQNDITFDIRSEVKPDYVMDVRFLFTDETDGNRASHIIHTKPDHAPRGILIDRPYTEEDADEYGTRASFPKINSILEDALTWATGGVRIGVIDYIWPSARNGREVAVVAVGCGRNNRARFFSVWEPI